MIDHNHPRAPAVTDTGSFARVPPASSVFRDVHCVALSGLRRFTPSRHGSSGRGLRHSAIGHTDVPGGHLHDTLRRHRWLSAVFRKKGRLYKLLSGRWLSIPLWTIWGLGVSFFLLLQFHVYEPVEWAVVAATIPLFAFLFAFTNRRLLKAGMHSDMAVTEALAPALDLSRDSARALRGRYDGVGRPPAACIDRGRHRCAHA